jgi:hypothetical protein
MTVPIGSIVRAVVSYYHPAGSIAQNVFFYEMQDKAADESNLLDDLETWFIAAWLGNWDDLADNTTYASLLDVDVVNGAGEVTQNIGQKVLAHFGVGTGETSPAAVSGYIHRETERAGSLARKYVPFIAEGNITDGLLTAGAFVYLVNLIGNMGATVTVDGTGKLVPGVLSRVTQSFQEMGSGTYATNVPAYQRRRKPDVGS